MPGAALGRPREGGPPPDSRPRHHLRPPLHGRRHRFSHDEIFQRDDGESGEVPLKTLKMSDFWTMKVRKSDSLATLKVGFPFRVSLDPLKNQPLNYISMMMATMWHEICSSWGYVGNSPSIRKKFLPLFGKIRSLFGKGIPAISSHSFGGCLLLLSPKNGADPSNPGETKGASFKRRSHRPNGVQVGCP